MPPALLISLHGWGGRISSHEALTGLSALADKEGFVVVFPQGQGDANNSKGNWFSWNGVGTNVTTSSSGVACKENHTAVNCFLSCAAKSPSFCNDVGPTGPCSWTTCADDILFLEVLLDQLHKTL